MDIKRVTPQQFAQALPDTSHVFNSVAFTQLNAHKCLQVHYLLLSDTRLRAGFILGETDSTLRSPFSAPFGGPILKSRTRHLNTIDEIFATLHAYASSLGKHLEITLPPLWHNHPAQSLCVSSLLRLPGAVATVDVSYYASLNPSTMPQPLGTCNARIHQSLAQPFTFSVGGSSPCDIERAYNIVLANHQALGYPVRMTLLDMLHTTSIISTDTFFLTLPDGTDAAAAIIFHIRPRAAQVIYWGDDVSLRRLFPMHRLAHEITHYYASSGIEILDLGPATEHSIPNHGLAFFKESLGFTPSLRHTFHIPPILASQASPGR